MPAQPLPFFTRVRYASSFISMAVLNLRVFGLSLRSVCSPGMNCHYCPWATAACPVGALAYGSAMRTIPVLVLGLVLAVGVVLGRIACGFLCPFGLLQDVLYRIPSKKIALPKAVRYLKYAALALLVLAFPFLLGFREGAHVSVGEPLIVEEGGESLSVSVMVENVGGKPLRGLDLDIIHYDPTTGEEVSRIRRSFPDEIIQPGDSSHVLVADLPPAPRRMTVLAGSPQSVVPPEPRFGLYFCKICPVGALTASLPSRLTGTASQAYGLLGGIWLSLVVLVFFLVLMVLSSRPFCRTLCPLGAIYGLVSRVSLARIEVDKNACDNCGACDNVCPVELDVTNEAGGAECIACGDCIAACTKGAIRWRFGL